MQSPGRPSFSAAVCQAIRCSRSGRRSFSAAVVQDGPGRSSVRRSICCRSGQLSPVSCRRSAALSFSRSAAAGPAIFSRSPGLPVRCSRSERRRPSAPSPVGPVKLQPAGRHFLLIQDRPGEKRDLGIREGYISLSFFCFFSFVFFSAVDFPGRRSTGPAVFRVP